MNKIDMHQRKVLLVNVNDTDARELSILLKDMGVIPVVLTVSKFNSYEMDSVCFVIVDIKTNSLNDFKEVSKHKKIKKDEIPILSIVNQNLQGRENIYICGGYDYIVSPLVYFEAKHRLAQAYNFRIFEKTMGIKSKNDDNASRKMALNVVVYLTENMANCVNLNDLAKVMATNRNTLSKNFKNEFGVTIFDWLREKRMHQAKNLLLVTSDSILDVAKKVGYADSNNFSTSFKSIFRKSPLQYRKQYAQDSVI